MSTKTLRKRIALVAVSALGAGLLSVVAVPSANAAETDAIAANNVYINTPTAGSNLAVGVCAVDAAAGNGATSAASVSTSTVAAVGSKLTFKVVTNGLGTLKVSGPAHWSAIPVSSSSTTTTANDSSIDSDSKAVRFVDTSIEAYLVVDGTGAITVTSYNHNVEASITSTIETFGITGVTSCASNVPSVTKSVAVFARAADVQATSTLTDWAAESVSGTPDPSSIDVGSTVYISVYLRDSYGADIATAGALTASATNGAYIAWDTDTAVGSTAVKSTAADSNDAVDLKVTQDPNKAGTPLSTNVTIQFNGVTIATKSVSIQGNATTLTVTDVTVGDSTGGNTVNKFSYTVKDAAGNLVAVTPAATMANAGITSGGVVASVTTAGAYTGTYPDNGNSGVGRGTFVCNANKSGSQKVQIAYTTSAITTVTSNEFTVTCGSSTVDTFSVATDKATYAPGEIAKLTITGLDANGGIVSNRATAGAAYSNISMPGMTLIGTAISSSDTFDGGVLVYKYRVDQTEGSYVGQAQVTATTDTAAETVQYKIAASSASVTNAEVLAAIVKLIASINKQITALQKMLTKKK